MLPALSGEERRLKNKIKWTTDDEGQRSTLVSVWMSEGDFTKFTKLADEKHRGYLGNAIVSSANGRLLLDTASEALVDIPRKKVWPKIRTLNCIAASCYDQKGEYSIARFVSGERRNSPGFIKWNGEEVPCSHYCCDECGLKFLDEPQINRLSDYLTFMDSSLPHIPIPESGWLIVKSTQEPARRKRAQNERDYRLKREMWKPRKRRSKEKRNP
jgi:hypothetical protein